MKIQDILGDNMPTIQESKGRFSIAIPHEYIKLLNLRKGELLAASINDKGDLKFRKIPEQNLNVKNFSKLSEASPLKGTLQKLK